MAKDIEQIIDDFVVPEMEYEPKYDKKRSKKKDTVTVTIDEIPEVVLPKTKAEVYLEAKVRLNEKSSAVSRTSSRRRTKDETAATSDTLPRTKTKTRTKTKLVSEPIWVGSAEELVPFAWRNPLLADVKKPSKYYRAVVKSAHSDMLPAPGIQR